MKLSAVIPILVVPLTARAAYISPPSPGLYKSGRPAILPTKVVAQLAPRDNVETTVLTTDFVTGTGSTSTDVNTVIITSSIDIVTVTAIPSSVIISVLETIFPAATTRCVFLSNCFILPS